MDELFGLKMKRLNGVLHVTRQEIKASPSDGRSTPKGKKTKNNLKDRCYVTEKSLNIKGDCVSERGRKRDKCEKIEPDFCSDQGEFS